MLAVLITVIPDWILKTPLLGRAALLPSMMVVGAPLPVMVRFPVITSSARRLTV
jgi:hypothetical protein